ncbi:MAG: TetR/AcrR family transcriptional regulator [Bacteroidota bacterium]|nr:TetR/AcrR family transcriptional regulator [Bacteroidota bacterium]
MLETREHILITAFTLFMEKGYKSVTMSDLEKETGLTKGAFYHYFKSKEEIFIEVIDKYHLKNRNHILTEYEKNCSFSEFIDYQIKDISNKIVRMKKLANIESPDPFFISLMMDARKYYPDYIEKVKVMSQNFKQKWQNKIISEQKKGELKQDIDPDATAEILITLGMSMFKYLMINETPEHALEILARQFSQVYNLIKK